MFIESTMLAFLCKNLDYKPQSITHRIKVKVYSQCQVQGQEKNKYLVAILKIFAYKYRVAINKKHPTTATTTTRS